MRSGHTFPFDYTLFILCLLSSLYGLVLIASAVRSFGTSSFIYIQTAALVLGCALFFFFSFIDLGRLTRLWPAALGLELILLGSLFFFGVGESNHGWIRFAGIGIQPAELGKLVFIFSFASQLTECKRHGFRLSDITALALHAVLVTGFVAVFSRDDGMSLAYVGIALSMAFIAGVQARYFLLGTAALGFAWPYVWSRFMDDYQRERILAVFSPSAYPDAAYQAENCRRAISSGGLTGLGYQSGTLTQRGLIPAKHTDSIIAAAGEELGLIGCAVILLLLILIIIRCLMAALREPDTAVKLMAFGVAAMLIFQTLLNFGMNLGLLPIVGLTLPFFSYGGSSLVTMFAAAGIISGISRRSRCPSSIYLRN